LRKVTAVFYKISVVSKKCVEPTYLSLDRALSVE
jgi:hypothetical protein